MPASRRTGISSRMTAGVAQVPGSLAEALDALEARSRVPDAPAASSARTLIRTWIDYKRENEVGRRAAAARIPRSSPSTTTAEWWPGWSRPRPNGHACRPAVGRAPACFEPDDWAAVAEIYWDGMRDGLATFQTGGPLLGSLERRRTCAGHRLVAELLGEVVAWAALSPRRTRRCYSRRRRGQHLRRGVKQVGSASAGRCWSELIAGAEVAGIWTIQTSIFPENRASLALHERCGFRVVGTRERVAKRDGIWRDTVFLERRSEVIS